jgi:outer membrane protein assembly factor BamB
MSREWRPGWPRAHSSPDTGSSARSAPTVADGVVYPGGPRDSIVARRAHDGSLLWQSSPGYIATSPLVAGGVVYAAGLGSVYGLRA